MRDELKAELGREMPDIEEITGKLVRERVDEERRKFEFEREQMIKDL